MLASEKNRVLAKVYTKRRGGLRSRVDYLCNGAEAGGCKHFVRWEEHMAIGEWDREALQVGSEGAIGLPRTPPRGNWTDLRHIADPQPHGRRSKRDKKRSSKPPSCACRGAAACSCGANLAALRNAKRATKALAAALATFAGPASSAADAIDPLSAPSPSRRRKKRQKAGSSFVSQRGRVGDVLRLPPV
jgi:hypothetical protein